MRLALLLAAVLALPAAAQAPDTLAITPGDGVLVTDWLASESRTYALRVTAPVQQEIGTATETVTVADGAVTRVLRMTIPMQGVSQTDSLVADAATLAPRVHRSTGGAQEASLEFMAEGVVGMLTPRQGEAETVTLMTDAPVFDTAWAGEIAQILPFAEGFVARVEAFATQNAEAPISVVYTVTGQEAVMVDGAERTAWAVDTAMGPLTMTYFVDAETRAMLKTEFSPQPGVTIQIAPTD